MAGRGADRLGLAGRALRPAPISASRRARSTRSWCGACSASASTSCSAIPACLSFGQSAFYGTGGFIAAYLLDQQSDVERHRRADRRHDRRGGGGRADRRDRAAPHRHLFRDDHRRDRRDVLLHREQRRSRPGPAARTAFPACRRRASPSAASRTRSATAGRCTGSWRSATSSASSSRCASCARRSARSSARSATTRCARARSATRSGSTSSPPSSSPPPMPGSPAACWACCRASCRPRPSPSTPRASSSCRPRSAAAARCSGRWWARRCGSSCATSCKARWASAARGSWCWASSSCCWSASCAAA